MLHFDRVSIGNRHYLMTELTFNAAIKIAKMSESDLEQRLTVFLQTVLNDDLLPLQITAQERYALLLNYLKEQHGTLLETNLNVANFLMLPNSFQTEIEIEGFKIKQLYGMACELLEKNCKNLADWLAGAMAMQLLKTNSDMPPLPDVSMTYEDYQQCFFERVAYLKNLPVSEFNQYFDIFSKANSALNNLVRIDFDEVGLVLRGTDDAPYRFCPSSTFTGIISELDRYFTQSRTVNQSKRQHESV